MGTPLQGLTFAEEASGWLASGDPAIATNILPQSYEVPYSPNYNTDCDTRDFDVIVREAKPLPPPYYQQTELRHSSTCAVRTPRGMHDGRYLDAGVPAGKFWGNSGFMATIPNSNTLMSISSGATNLDQSISFYDAIVPEYNPITGEVLYNVAGHRYMTDRSGKKINVRANSIGYSSGGRWMVVETVLGFARVDLLYKGAREILPFAPALTYGTGTSPMPRVAISADGRYAAVTSRNNVFRIYDLSTCSSVPDSITGPVGCQYKDVEPYLIQKFGTYNGSYYLRFASPELLTFIVEYPEGAGTRRSSVRLAPSGRAIGDITYLAMGDSFSSGEGMRDVPYIKGTDEDGRRMYINPQGDYEIAPENECHLSSNSYPYLVAEALAIGSRFHNVACSGAMSANYASSQRGAGEVKDSPLGFWLPGYESQKRYLQVATPDAVTISMIGNDIGFGEIVKRCIIWPDTCYGAKEEREVVAEEIYDKFETLKNLYNAIKTDSNNPDVRIYVLGYPQLISEVGACGANVRFNAEEVKMGRGLVTYLNAVIEAAAKATGVQYINVEDAFAGHQLCDPGAKAVNGLTAGDDRILGIGPIGNESYHPNELGHELLSAVLLEQSERLTKPMPAADSSVTAPFTDSLTYYRFIGEVPSSGVPLRTQRVIPELESIQVKNGKISPRSDIPLRPDSTFEAVFHSIPTPAGTMTVDTDGQLTGEITVPDSLEPGYHTLHLYGQNLAGEEIDLHGIIYVAASEDDIDGDGIPNDDEKCLGVEPADVDEDRDGVDDACDAEITEAPVDAVPPAVTGAPDREPNEHGWYNSDVTVNWTATDPDPSSGTPTQPAPTIASQEGARAYVSGQSCDPLNNCATGSLELKIDKTAPDIAYSLSPAPNAQGWHNNAVTVTFTCSDATSGVDACSGQQTVSGADGMYVVTGSATDEAGNNNAVNVFVSLDSTNPTISQTVSSDANAYGWYNSDVTVAPTCDDNLSGVLECSFPVTLSTEGANQTVTSSATDKAGNSTSASTTVNIDKTTPILGTVLWSNNPKSVMNTASVTVPVSDNLSGIAEAEYYLGDTDPGQGNGATMQVGDDSVSVGFNTDFPTGVYKVTVRAMDKAGNWSAPVVDYLVVYDPFGIRMTGKRTLLPSLSGGDVLPGLVDPAQDDRAKFGFNIRYKDDGSGIHPHSDFQFKYETGNKCNKPAQATNCHSFELNATSIAWLVTEGVNDSTGIFQGDANLRVDGATSNVVFRLAGLDAQHLNQTGEDHLTLEVYPDGANPNTHEPIYVVDDDVLRGNIKIYKR